MPDESKTLAYSATEIDAAIGAVGSKVDKETGKGLSTNDYTDSEKTKLSKFTGIDIFTLGTALKSNDDLNSLTEAGKWYATSTAIAATIVHSPVTTAAFFVINIPSVAGSRYIQILIPNDDSGDWYKRRYVGASTWNNWIKYTGTVLT